MNSTSSRRAPGRPEKGCYVKRAFVPPMLSFSAEKLPLLTRRLRPLARGLRLPYLLFAATCLLMAVMQGVLHGGDTSRYLNGAERFINGEPLHAAEGAYFGYIVFVALVQVLGAGATGIIVAQVLISALCVAALYDLGRRVAGEIAGVSAASLYAVNVDVARFTFAILTDSLYTSGLILSVYLTYRALAIDRRWAGPAAAIVLITATLRPSGIFITPIFGAFLAFALLRERGLLWQGLATAAVLTGSLLFVLSPARSVLSWNDPVQWLIEGTVIWGHDESRMEMPPADIDDGGRVSALGYCSDWPVACARLFVERVRSSFMATRPYYSSRHNLIIWLLFPPLYALAAVGFWATRRQPLTALALAVIGIHAAVIGLTTDDWDGRYLTYVFPLITLYSGVGIAKIVWRFSASRAPAVTA